MQECGHILWSLEQIKSELHLPVSKTLGYFKDNRLKGFVCLRVFGSEAEIVNIAVSACSQKQGIGRFLVENSIKYLTENGVERIFLEVNKENLPAINLYEKSGFCLIYERDNYYPSKNCQSQSANALVYEFKLANSVKKS